MHGKNNRESIVNAKVERLIGFLNIETLNSKSDNIPRSHFLL